MSPLDRFDLYEACVQSPDDLVPVLRAIHGADPRILGEDFCGTAALARRWVTTVPKGRAVVVDLDPEPLARIPVSPSITVIEADVLATDPAAHAADVIYTGNFSIGEWHERAALLAYLRRVRSRLKPAGVFVCDLYGGETAFSTGATDREILLPDGEHVRYTWEQRFADPLTGRVENACHFERLDAAGAVTETWRDAFVYAWRLWGLPELRDAMAEAGFARTEVYPRVADAMDDEGTAYVLPITDPDELEESFEVLIAARVASPSPS